MGAPVVHFEIGCRDLAKTSGFYKSMFGWTTMPYGPAEMIDTGTKEGIMGHITALGHEPHQYMTIYAQVDDLNAYLDKAVALGGKKVVPPTEVPNMGHFAWCTDPEGRILGLWKPMKKA